MNRACQGAHARISPGGRELFKFFKNDIIEEQTRTLFQGRLWINFLDKKNRSLWTVLSDRKGNKVAKFVMVPPGSKFSRRDSSAPDAARSRERRGTGSTAPQHLIDQRQKILAAHHRNANMTVRGIAAQTALAKSEISPEEFQRLSAVLSRAREAEGQQQRYVPVPSQAEHFLNSSFQAGLESGVGHTLLVDDSLSRCYAYGAGFQNGLDLRMPPSLNFESGTSAADAYALGRAMATSQVPRPSADSIASAERGDATLAPASPQHSDASAQAPAPAPAPMDDHGSDNDGVVPLVKVSTSSNNADESARTATDQADPASDACTATTSVNESQAEKEHPVSLSEAAALGRGLGLIAHSHQVACPPSNNLEAFQLGKRAWIAAQFAHAQDVLNTRSATDEVDPASGATTSVNESQAEKEHPVSLSEAAALGRSLGLIAHSHQVACPPSNNLEAFQLGKRAWIAAQFAHAQDVLKTRSATDEVDPASDATTSVNESQAEKEHPVSLSEAAALGRGLGLIAHSHQVACPPSNNLEAFQLGKRAWIAAQFAHAQDVPKSEAEALNLNHNIHADTTPQDATSIGRAIGLAALSPISLSISGTAAFQLGRQAWNEQRASAAQPRSSSPTPSTVPEDSSSTKAAGSDTSIAATTEPVHAQNAAMLGREFGLAAHSHAVGSPLGTIAFRLGQKAWFNEHNILLSNDDHAPIVSNTHDSENDCEPSQSEHPVESSSASTSAAATKKTARPPVDSYVAGLLAARAVGVQSWPRNHLDGLDREAYFLGLGAACNANAAQRGFPVSTAPSRQTAYMMGLGAGKAVCSNGVPSMHAHSDTQRLAYFRGMGFAAAVNRPKQDGAPSWIHEAYVAGQEAAGNLP
eukprot:INCI16266.6.p1 GENE.INCI16266.6~~INCI16266.6.p1  ORF type:complete len:867 (+),score=115.01 INCI16266.6:86-2686(+)